MLRWESAKPCRTLGRLDVPAGTGGKRAAVRGHWRLSCLLGWRHANAAGLRTQWRDGGRVLLPEFDAGGDETRSGETGALEATAFDKDEARSRAPERSTVPGVPRPDQ